MSRIEDEVLDKAKPYQDRAGGQTMLGGYDEDYSAYHSPQDTLENMVAVVGGQENLEESIEFVLWAAFLEFVLADQDPEIRNVNA
tara:strand:- start:240 stop:494 length:255 start_codon:yes stop_codon:yes gene_type:complete